jgi:hypothetical protein
MDEKMVYEIPNDPSLKKFYCGRRMIDLPISATQIEGK